MGDASLVAARRHGDPTVIMSALQCLLIYEEDPFVYTETAAEICELALALNDLWAYCYARGSYVRGLMRLGRLAEAREALPELREAADRGRFVLYRYQSITFDVMFAVIDGRLDESEKLSERASAFGAAARTEFGAGVYGMQMYAIRREQGRLEDVVPAMRVAAALEVGQAVWRPGLAALFADVGMVEEAPSEFDALAADHFAAVPRDATWPGSLTYLSEVCMTLADRAQAGVLYQELQAFEGQTMQVGFTVNLGPADRLRGNLAALLSRRAEAELHFAAAMELAVAAQSPVWRARIAHDWAVALAPQPALLHEANELAMQVGMEDLVRRTRRELLGLQRPAEGAPQEVSSLPDGLSSRRGGGVASRGGGALESRDRPASCSSAPTPSRTTSVPCCRRPAPPIAQKPPPTQPDTACWCDTIPPFILRLREFPDGPVRPKTPANVKRSVTDVGLGGCRRCSCVNASVTAPVARSTRRSAPVLASTNTTLAPSRSNVGSMAELPSRRGSSADERRSRRGGSVNSSGVSASGVGRAE